MYRKRYDLAIGEFGLCHTVMPETFAAGFCWLEIGGEGDWWFRRWSCCHLLARLKDLRLVGNDCLT